MPVVVRITSQYSEQVQKRIQIIEALSDENEDLINETEAEINDLIQQWQSKIQKLGGVTKGLWIADFDSGDGYFCWKYPEERILFWHKYSDGFSGRISIEKYLNKQSGRRPPEQTV